MKRNFKKFAKIGAGVMAAALMLVGSFAYFTDRVATNATATAGTVDLALDDSGIVLTDADGQDIFNPGDIRDVDFTVANEGNKSVDVRTTIKLTSSVPMDTTAAQAEYELYRASDVKLVAGEGYQLKDDVSPVPVRSISNDGTVITYAIPDYTLNGDSSLAEKETETGISTDENTYDYVLLFKGTSSNDFQDSTARLDVLVEAKQHRNTGAGWNIVAQESYTAGSINQNAVPAA